jgi:DNA-binding transcriptional LysR family regulator
LPIEKLQKDSCHPQAEGWIGRKVAMLDAHQLNVFLAAAETLNFTKAAERLHMTQPSVSQHIQSLEQHFGIQLFVRSGRRIELSDGGMALVPLARELVQQSICIEENMASLKGEVHGHLLVGCSTTPGKYILPHLLARFHDMHPRVQVTCQVTSQFHAVQMLNDGDTHFALTSLSQDISKESEYMIFLEDPICLIAPLDHPWALRGIIEPEELKEAGYIMRENTSGTYTSVREGLSRVGVAIDELETHLTLGNSEAIALAVEEGLGIGFISRIVVTHLVPDRVAMLQIRGAELTRDIYIGRHTRRPATIAQTAFWEFVNSLEKPINNGQPVTARMLS